MNLRLLTRKKTFMFAVIVFVVIAILSLFYVNHKSIFIQKRKGCEYLTKVESLQDLLIQINKSIDNSCLQAMSAEELAAIWGIEIYEFDSYETYTNSRLTSGWETESSKKAFDKPYQKPNDAYVVTRVNYEDKYYDLYITATKDYLIKHKGLNQWILKKYDDKSWCDQRTDLKDESVPYVEPDLLPGFVEPWHTYFICGGQSKKESGNQPKNCVRFSAGTLKNNYVKVIEVKIWNN